jgi:hypothetical protein
MAVANRIAGKARGTQPDSLQAGPPAPRAGQVWPPSRLFDTPWLHDPSPSVPIKKRTGAKFSFPQVGMVGDWSPSRRPIRGGRISQQTRANSKGQTSETSRQTTLNS